jgi:hypothetical protein
MTVSIGRYKTPPVSTTYDVAAWRDWARTREQARGETAAFGAKALALPPAARGVKLPQHHGQTYPDHRAPGLRLT